MGITIRKHRRNLSYDDATTLDELWVISKQFDRSFYREWKDHWDERGYDEYIVVTEGRLPYCESPEEYVCRMETRREILAVLALCTEKQRSKIKAILRKLKIRLLPQLPHGIAEAFSLIRPSDCIGWFSAAGIPC